MSCISSGKAECCDLMISGLCCTTQFFPASLKVLHYCQAKSSNSADSVLAFPHLMTFWRAVVNKGFQGKFFLITGYRVCLVADDSNGWFLNKNLAAASAIAECYGSKTCKGKAIESISDRFVEKNIFKIQKTLTVSCQCGEADTLRREFTSAP